jgi:Rrf2 family nitric oxide-sensitive transcriptional repressor
MRLTIYTDYALRVLIYLTANRGKQCSVGEIADSYQISKHHLMKVAQDLAAAGMIETIRGNGGGIRLIKPPHMISIGDVVRRTETDMFLVGCFDPAGKGCTIEGACILAGALKEALNAFMAVIDKYTVADLMAKRPQLVQLLGIPALVVNGEAVG